MLAGMRRALQSFQISVEAAGSSIAVRTSDREGSSRSEGTNLRSMWVTCLWAMRCATSRLRPEVGETTVTRASALRQFSMRPAATCAWRDNQSLVHRNGEGDQELTSPPPTTRTFLPLICQARIKLPPPCTCGNSTLSPMVAMSVSRRYGHLEMPVACPPEPSINNEIEFR